MASRKTLFCHFPYLITEPGRVHRVADRDAEDRGLPGLASAAEEVIGEVSLRGNQTDPLAPVHRDPPWRGHDSGTWRFRRGGGFLVLRVTGVVAANSRRRSAKKGRNSVKLALFAVGTPRPPARVRTTEVTNESK